MSEDLQGTLRQSDSVVARQIAGQWLLIPIHGTAADLQKIFTLNETSAAIWSLLAEPTTFDRLVSRLREEFAAPEEVIAKDAEEFIRDLLRRGFVAREAGDE